MDWLPEFLPLLVQDLIQSVSLLKKVSKVKEWELPDGGIL